MMMERDKMRGHLFENMVIMNFLKDRFNRGLNGGMYFFRDSNCNDGVVVGTSRRGQEVDVMEAGCVLKLPHKCKFSCI